MRSSRREFLKRGTLWHLQREFRWPSPRKPWHGHYNRAAGLNMASFKSQLGTSFLINHEASKVKITLVDVTNFASQKQTAKGKEGFSLLFRGPKETLLNRIRI